MERQGYFNKNENTSAYICHPSLKVQALPFDKKSSKINLAREIKEPNVPQEIELGQRLLTTRKKVCPGIKPVAKRPPKQRAAYAHRFFCVCTRHKPPLGCKHYGNVVIDRDMLTRSEYVTLLMQKPKTAAQELPKPYTYSKRIRLPDSTPRIVEMANPDPKYAAATLRRFKHVLKPQNRQRLAHYAKLSPKHKQYTSVKMAIRLVAEERRQRKATYYKRKKYVNRAKRAIIKQQRRQIEMVICILFEQMRDFLMTDHLIVDKDSTLYIMLLQELREFTENEFHASKNIKDFQAILANNLAAWINNFIVSMEVRVPPRRAEPTTPPLPESYLPVEDYISHEDSCETLQEGSTTAEAGTSKTLVVQN